MTRLARMMGVSSVSATSLVLTGRGSSHKHPNFRVLKSFFLGRR